MDNIIWKDLKNFGGLYQINNEGTVKSLDRYVYHNGNDKFQFIRGRKISMRVNNHGYLSIRLSRDSKTATRFVHRLLAETFIENPLELPFVNHKDGNKLNNALDNLEWVTHSQNMKHAYSMGLIKGKSKIPSILIKPDRVLKKYRDMKKQNLGIEKNVV
ncbi:MAG: NUMOD4 motif-containing HNH endonuclease [Chitinophagaceae bacterium]|nr:NUMOD4 motif-containing HNH endonuclease [Chitinophagaceae bacterium]